ncbi:polymer-forming cytoskeletal protein [Dysgonomonas mossii]|uniref:Polymer-forming cytoskeletal protein n=1 Tax=Dysgonomonas mossii DSM 22836 TaxID=742767 RepID=F8X3V2_9BACT|nr:polymer-forming cytoskeletal protein [Dysgonomonas mossii]EGK05241.1 hypothetical protein HMPREF9456_02911 [Dysgonomonas mossii DSM 22836]
MFLIKRKKVKIIKEDVAEVVVLYKDIIVLGAFRFTGMQTGDFFVKGTATIDLSASVEGDVTAMDCCINGVVEGNVRCANNLWLGSSAIIKGSIMAQKAVMETGCKVNGAVLLAPKVEVSTLVAKIIEAEKIILKRDISEIQEIFSSEADIPLKSAFIPSINTLTKEQEIIDVKKPESSPVQFVDKNDDWW